MPENSDDGDISWPSYRRYVLAELKRGIENDTKTVIALNEIKSAIADSDTGRAKIVMTLDEVSKDQKTQLGMLDNQQKLIDSMRTKWAIVMAIGVVIVFLIEHIGIPLIFPSLRH